MQRVSNFKSANFKSVGMAAAVLLVSGLAACSPRLAVHGSVIDEQRLSEIKPGEITRQEVQELIGSPSSKAVFDKESWYYISSRTEAVAFFEPKITERKVIIVRFDDKGVVSDIEKLNLKDGRPVQIVERVTPTKGKEFTFIEQVVGNIGRFTGGLNKER